MVRGIVAAGLAAFTAAAAAAAAAQPAQPARAAPPPPAAGLEAERGALAAAERAFAKLAEEKGVRDAFLAYLADDAVLFRPRAVPGKEWVSSHPSPPIRLSWRPAFVEVAAAGDLGYTTGPYEVRGTRADDTAVSHGWFVTIWKKQPDSAWRVALDVGTPNPGAPPPPATGAAAAGLEHGGRREPRGGAAAVDLAAARASLLEADRAFAKASLVQGTRPAYLAWLAPEARFYRDGSLPLVGKETIRRALSASGRPEVLTWEPARADVSRSGDLGYTYGISGVKEDGPEGMTSNLGNYLRIWEKQSDLSWRVVLDWLQPLPPLAPPKAAAPPPAATPPPSGVR